MVCNQWGLLNKRFKKSKVRKEEVSIIMVIKWLNAIFKTRLTVTC